MSGNALHMPMDPAALVSLHERRVALIRQAANEAREVDYRHRWGDVLARCAAWFSSLPFSPALYREPGGAFRCTVETAFYAMRLSGGQKFGTNLPSEKRRGIEPQYNHAVFLAAVCSALDEPYRHFVVLRQADRTEWSPAAHGALGPWLAGGAYALQRRATPLPVERMRTALLAQQLIGQDLLAGYEAEVLAQLFGAINPLQQPQANESLVHKVVRQAVVVAADFDRKAQQGVYEAVQYPVPSAVHVAAAVEPVVVQPPAPASAPEPSGAAPQPVASTQAATPESAAVPPPAGSASGPIDSAAPVLPSPTGGNAPASLAEVVADEMARQEPPAAGATPTAATGSPASSPSPVAARPSPDPQLGLPFAGEPPAPVAIDPAAVRPRVPRPEPHGAIDQVLEGQPNMIREFFRALKEDVAAGKAKVAWGEKGLALPKRLVGSYGVASDTLVEHLRRRSLLVANVQTEIVLAPRAGELILERPPE